MANGVEVIIAGTSPAYRLENASFQPTLTLSEAVVMLLPHQTPNEFVTKTCTTTFTYLNTITRDGTTFISTNHQVIANTVTEERHRKPIPEATSILLKATPTLQTEVFQTTYTYLTLNTEGNNALDSSIKVISNTVTAPQYYLDMILDTSEVQKPDSNTFFSTKTLDKTYTKESDITANMSDSINKVGLDSETLKILTSHTQTVQKTESDSPELLDVNYKNGIAAKPHFSVSATSYTTEQSTVNNNKTLEDSDGNTSHLSALNSVGSNHETMHTEEEAIIESTNSSVNKKPSQVSNLLNLGSLGINSLSALGPVITAMAGLLQGKSSANRRNDTEFTATESTLSTTPRLPIYIPVAEFVHSDIEAAESQTVVQAVNINQPIETRHKIASSIADGIPISPGEIITANSDSDVIIGKHGKMGPRPPPNILIEDSGLVLSPPSPNPNLHHLHSMLEVTENDISKHKIKLQKNPQNLEILPAQQIYEEHIHIHPAQMNTRIMFASDNGSIEHSPYKQLNSKKDILVNDPLLLPPAKLNANVRNNLEKNRQYWYLRDAILEKGTQPFKSYININSDFQNGSFSNQPIVKMHTLKIHQMPHVIDRSTGQPLLVHIQPSQIANVIIPPKGNQALIFGDSGEPHKSGQYFDDPSPHPDSKAGHSYIEPNIISKGNLNDYMIPPPSPIKKHKIPQMIPISQETEMHTNIDGTLLLKPISHNIHPNSKSGFSFSPASNVDVNYNIFLPKKDPLKIPFPVGQIPPRRTEINLPTEVTINLPESIGDSNKNMNHDKKHIKYNYSRRPRPTHRPLLPVQITLRPYNRLTRRPTLKIADNKKITLPPPYINQFHKSNYPTMTVPSFIHTKTYSHLMPTKNKEYSQLNSDVYSSSHRESSYVTTNLNRNNTNIVDDHRDLLDSDFEASENEGITLRPKDNYNPINFVPEDRFSTHIDTVGSDFADPYQNKNQYFETNLNNNNKNGNYEIDISPNRNNTSESFTSGHHHQKLKYNFHISHETAGIKPIDFDSINLEKTSVPSDADQDQNEKYVPITQFSLPINSNGDEYESKIQTERPSDNMHKNHEPSIDLSGMRNNYLRTRRPIKNRFNHSITDDQENLKMYGERIYNKHESHKTAVTNGQKTADHSEVKKLHDYPQSVVLKPPTEQSDVFNVKPLPADVKVSSPNKVNRSKANINISGLKPPPIYVPIRENKPISLVPSTNMTPPASTSVKPYLVNLLAQDMVPPKPFVDVIKPLGTSNSNIGVGTAFATTNIPVIYDNESKIPIVHGTVDLPFIIDVPEFLKPDNTKKSNQHASVYSVLPFGTVRRSSIKPTSTSSIPSSSVQKNKFELENRSIIPSAKAVTPYTREPNKPPDLTIHLEPSAEIYPTTSSLKPTETLDLDETQNRIKDPTPVTYSTKLLRKSNFIIPSKQFSKTHGIIKTLLETQTSSLNLDDSILNNPMKSQKQKVEQSDLNTEEITHFETTIIKTTTTVITSPSKTRTLLLTHTLTSTSVETLTETVHPTKVISRITSTIHHTVTGISNQEPENDNDSIFIVMSDDQKPPVFGADEVEAEYGEEEISRDEEDISKNRIHNVLSGGILGVPSVPINPPAIQCLPECKSSKGEVCAERNGEIRCVCRPGFARMFLDRPCKPTYTFTLTIGLYGIGRDRFDYDPRLNITNPDLFARYTELVKEALDRMFMQSDLRDHYGSISISKLLPAPTRVQFNVQLTANTNESTLVDVIRKYLILNNFSLGGTEVYALKDLNKIVAVDFDECKAERGLYHDCSLNSTCFNLKGTYQCSCKEGWADLSENSLYPGRICSQAPLGCNNCNNKGVCLRNTYGKEICECFPWHTGQKCQVNLKVLFIVIITAGGTIFGLLALFVGVTCFRNSSRKQKTDAGAIISGPGGDTNSEGSAPELAIPYHVPHVLPPPPQVIAPVPPNRRFIGKTFYAARRHVPVNPSVSKSNTRLSKPSRGKSFPVMIPRAKYRSGCQPTNNQVNQKSLNTFATDEQRLIDYLDDNQDGNQKSSFMSSDHKEPNYNILKQNNEFIPTGALISAGFQVSATVTRKMDAETTLTRSSIEASEEPLSKVLQPSEFSEDIESRLIRPCQESSIKSSTKQVLQFDMGECGSTLARSCGETTIQPPTKLARVKNCNKDTRDSASEGHTMAERDVGMTLRLPAAHLPLYNHDRMIGDRDSNFDSL